MGWSYVLSSTDAGEPLPAASASIADGARVVLAVVDRGDYDAMMTMRIGLMCAIALALASSARAQTVDFTLITAVRLSDLDGAANTLVSDYVYFVDPLSRGITMAGAAVRVPSTEDRLSVVAAGVITPAGGFGVGASGLIGRGFGVTAGLAWLLVNAPKDGKDIGDVADDLSDPFKIGVARTWFVGANYTFQRNR